MQHRTKSNRVSITGWWAITGMAVGMAVAQERLPDASAASVDRFQSASGEMLGTGARRPTAQQWAWGEAHLQKTRKVHLNPLGLERVNSVRQGSNQAPLRAAAGTTGAAAPDPTVSSADAPVVPLADIPAHVDNSTLKYFPPIRNQGALGSCAQFAAVYYTLTHMTAMARDWDAKNGGDQYRFSPKWTYNMLNGGDDLGSWHYDAYLIAMQHGAATWAEFPYDADYRGWCLNPKVWRDAINVRADQAGKVTDLRTDASLAQLKSLLVNGYVLNFATYIGSWKWLTAGDDPATTADDALVGRSIAYKVSGTSGGHTMTVVGYNDAIWVDINGDAKITADEKGALRIANSWGPEWKEGGFTWLSYAALKKLNASYPYEGVFWYDEATWITARPTYTPRLLAEFTVSQSDRSQMQVLLGVSVLNATVPSRTWSSDYTLSFAGGPWAFDGSTTAIAGSFCFDLTDLLAGQTGEVSCYLGIRDFAAGEPTTLTAWRLMNGTTGRETTCSGTAQMIDATQVFVALGSESAVADFPPVACFDVAPAAGVCPLPVSFDARPTHDPDGVITAYAWDFGDGTTATGPLAQHTYTRAGSYDVTLTVTDDTGRQDTIQTAVTATDLRAFAASEGVAVDFRTLAEHGTNDVVLCVLLAGEWIEVGRQAAVGTGDNLYRFVVKGLPPGAAYTFRVSDEHGGVQVLNSVPVNTLQVRSLGMSGEGMALAWDRVPGVVYGIRRAASLAGPWSTVVIVPASEVGGPTTVVAPVDPAATGGFFKIAVEP